MTKTLQERIDEAHRVFNNFLRTGVIYTFEVDEWISLIADLAAENEKKDARIEELEAESQRFRELSDLSQRNCDGLHRAVKDYKWQIEQIKNHADFLLQTANRI